ERLLERDRLLGVPGGPVVDRPQDARADARPGIELLDRRVGAVRDDRARLEERPVRVRAVGLAGPEAVGEVAVGRGMAELDRGGDAEAGEARQVLRGEKLRMLDPRP